MRGKRRYAGFILAILFGLVGAGCTLRQPDSPPPVVPIAAPSDPSPTPGASPGPFLPPKTATPGAPQTKPTLTHTARIPAVIQPIGDVPAPDLTDSVYRDLVDAGYILFQAGAITGDGGVVHAAYLFTRLKMGEPAGKDTFTIIIHRWEGDRGSVIGSFSPPVYSERIPVYPAYYRLANWDQPGLSLMGLNTPDLPTETTKDWLDLHGHAADLNRNGLPEFIFAGEYCPENCLQTVEGLDVIEVGGSSGLKTLTADLPGRLRLNPTSADPLVFEVDDLIWLDEGGAVPLPAFYAPVSGAWVERPEAGAAVILQRIEAERNRLSAVGGGMTGRDGAEAALYSLLLLNERLGQPQAGVEAFRQAADLHKWPGATPLSACWLQLASVLAQDDLAAGRPFSLLPPLIRFSPNVDLPRVLQSFAGKEHDLSACQRWLR